VAWDAAHRSRPNIGFQNENTEYDVHRQELPPRFRASSPMYRLPLSKGAGEYPGSYHRLSDRYSAEPHGWPTRRSWKPRITEGKQHIVAPWEIRDKQ